MADNKRNSVAAKVATPKTAGAQHMVDAIEALGKAVGAFVKVTTVPPLSHTFEGSLFTACPITNVVAVDIRAKPSNARSNSAAQPGDYHIIPVSRIQNFQVISLPPVTDEGTLATAHPPIGPVDLKRLKEREEARVTKLKEDEANRGRGVTKEGQAIFDSLRRVNIPIRWHNHEMIVHDAVIIGPPYRPEDCRGAKEKQQVINQVKVVLEGERRKLKERGELERKPATPPAGPRKGG